MLFSWSANRSFVVITLFAILATSSVFAKSQRFDWSETKVPGDLNGVNIQTFENRLQPFFENRILRRHYQKTPVIETPPPPEHDLLLVAKLWNRFSPQFRQLYKQAAQLPDSFQRYDSPGGHFEIYYTTSGPNRVATADNYGFLSTNWRSRTLQSNGIPDYIDETAFALDSTWSMEIDRFGFIVPLPYKTENHLSERYKVVVEAQDESYYGMTYLHDTLPGVRGYPSTISLRNDWSGGEWSALGYNIRPFDGIRVTCAHEFFHAVQYAMSRDVLLYVWLDDFPYSWTEGTAVSMEELAFDSVNDYHQYARTYFHDPGISFFSPATSDLVYTNAILLLYLFKHFPPGDSIAFVRSILLTNYAGRTPFHENLFSTAMNAGRSWIGLLHNFHTASFFTGSHADTARFTADAPFFTMRNVTPLETIDTITSAIPLNSVRQVRLIREPGHGDTATINFSAPDEAAAPANQTLACTALLRNQGTDSLITLPIDSLGRGSLTVTSWKNWSELIVVMTNGDPVDEKTASLFIQPYPVSYPKSTILNDTISDKQYNSTAIIHLEAKNDLHAPLKFEVAQQNPATDSEVMQPFIAITALYTIEIPSHWQENALIQLVLLSTAAIDTTDTIYLCSWNAAADAWSPLIQNTTTSTDTARFSIHLTESGIYALFRKNGQTAGSLTEITIYPNPLSIRKHGGTTYFRGNFINDIRIYSITGTLVWRIPPETFHSSGSGTIVKYPWKSSGTNISPGIYTAITVQNDPLERTPLRTHHKLLITP